jgi:hypothetical protein
MAIAPLSIESMDLRIGKSENRARGTCRSPMSKPGPDEGSDIRVFIFSSPACHGAGHWACIRATPATHAGYLLLAQNIGRTSG